MSPYAKTFTGTGSYAVLSSTPVPFKGNLVADPDNGSNILVTIGSNEVSLKAGQFIPIPGCNIAAIQIKGAALKLNALGSTDSGWK